MGSKPLDNVKARVASMVPAPEPLPAPPAAPEFEVPPQAARLAVMAVAALSRPV